MAGNDKKFYKQLSHQEGQNPHALSPPNSFVGSPLPGSMGSPTFSPTNPFTPYYYRMASGSSTCAPENMTSGPHFCDTISGKTLFNLRSLLTVAFQPDYDFMDAKSEEFSREPSVKMVMEAVRSNLSLATQNMYPQLWSVIDEEIILSECDIYR